MHTKFGESSLVFDSGAKDIIEYIESLKFNKKDGNYRLIVDFELKDQKTSRLYELKVIFVASDEIQGTLEVINKEPFAKYVCNFVEPKIPYPEYYRKAESSDIFVGNTIYTKDNNGKLWRYTIENVIDATSSTETFTACDEDTSGHVCNLLDTYVATRHLPTDVTIVHLKNGIEASRYFEEDYNSGC